VGELQSSLDALAVEDLKSLFGPKLLERLGPLLVAQNRIAAEVARTVRECELTGAAEHDGLKTMASWLRGHARLSPAAAAAVVRSGRALEHLPAVAAAFAEGSVTAAQVAVIAPVAGEPERAAAAERGIDLAVIDESMTLVALTQPHDKLVEVVKLYRDGLDPRRAGAGPDRGAPALDRQARRRGGQLPGRARRGWWGEVPGRDRVDRAGRPSEG
jgi:hypothetical protein